MGVEATTVREAHSIIRVVRACWATTTRSAMCTGASMGTFSLSEALAGTVLARSDFRRRSWSPIPTFMLVPFECEMKRGCGSWCLQIPDLQASCIVVVVGSDDDGGVDVSLLAFSLSRTCCFCFRQVAAWLIIRARSRS